MKPGTLFLWFIALMFVPVTYDHYQQHIYDGAVFFGIVLVGFVIAGVRWQVKN